MYIFMHLEEVLKYEFALKAQRIETRFLATYKRAGKAIRLSDWWIERREKAIRSLLAEYNKNPTQQARLALIAWAYMP